MSTVQESSKNDKSNRTPLCCIFFLRLRWLAPIHVGGGVSLATYTPLHRSSC